MNTLIARRSIEPENTIPVKATRVPGIRRRLSRWVGVGVVLSIQAARAAVLYYDDFECYSAGASLAGNGGWELVGAPFDRISPQVSNGRGLTSKVMDGHSLFSGVGGSRILRQLPSPLDPTRRTTFTFDAHVWSSGPKTHGWPLGFSASRMSNVGAIYWEFDNYTPSQLPSAPGPRWSLMGLTGERSAQVVGGVDSVVHLGIVIDGTTGQYWGTYDFGTGKKETAHFPITSAQIAAMQWLQSYLYVTSNGGGSRGGEFDNLLLVNDECVDWIPASVLGLSVTPTKLRYRAGEQFAVSSIVLANRTDHDETVELRCWLDLPGRDPVTLPCLSLPQKMTLPRGYTHEFGPTLLFKIDASMPKGRGAFGIRTIDPVTGEVLSEDVNSFLID